MTRLKRVTGTAGKALIIKWECSGDVRPFLKAYRDVKGVPTIGVGATFYRDGSRVKMGDEITLEEAMNLFSWHLGRVFEPAIHKLVKTPINQNQFDALVSFVFNVGEKQFGTSTLLQRINADPNHPDIPHQFARWNKSGGKIWPGLINRRKDEAALYVKPVK